jgi:hypothetical protein
MAGELPLQARALEKTDYWRIEIIVCSVRSEGARAGDTAFRLDIHRRCALSIIVT